MQRLKIGIESKTKIGTKYINCNNYKS